MTDEHGTGLLERETVNVDGVDMPIWPKGKLNLKKFDKEAVIGFNTDLPPLHQPLIDAIVEIDKRQRKENPRDRCVGGQKIRDLHLLGLPIFDLINERIKQLFRVTTGCKTAFVDDVWGNSMMQGEYHLPHSHKRTVASAVYNLDPGDDPETGFEPMNGVLMFADPRMPVCCQHKEGYVSTPAVVPRQMGAMILFPAQYTHLVTAYQGRRHRISLAWNINAAPHADKPKHDGVLT